MQLPAEYRQMAKFVKDYIESHDPIASELTARFPFRRRFEHCLRCSIWAGRIAAAEEADVETAVISALFHDIGKAGDGTGRTHGEVGAQICRDYLSSVGFDEEKTRKIVEIVRNHSSHARESDASLEARVVSDTDLLDEIGAVTVLWDAMACAAEDDPSYDKVRERIAESYERLKTYEPERVHTQTAKHILKGRLEFLDTFLNNLEYELGRTDTVP